MALLEGQVAAVTGAGRGIGRADALLARARARFAANHPGAGGEVRIRSEATVIWA